MSYNPKNEYNKIGYHRTLSVYLDNIKKNGFKPSNNDDDWLGMGVYFWDSIENAKWWNVGTGSVIEKCTIICRLKCDKTQYLDLDNDGEMNKFNVFCKKYMNNLKTEGLPRPKFKNNNQKKKFFCDLYCSCNGFVILSFTFKHDIINTAGFKVETRERKQICVRNPKNITIVSVEMG